MNENKTDQSLFLDFGLNVAYFWFKHEKWAKNWLNCKKLPEILNWYDYNFATLFTQSRNILGQAL